MNERCSFICLFVWLFGCCFFISYPHFICFCVDYIIHKLKQMLFLWISFHWDVSWELPKERTNEHQAMSCQARLGRHSLCCSGCRECRIKSDSGENYVFLFACLIFKRDLYFPIENSQGFSRLEENLAASLFQQNNFRSEKVWFSLIFAEFRNEDLSGYFNSTDGNDVPKYTTSHAIALFAITNYHSVHQMRLQHSQNCHLIYCQWFSLDQYMLSCYWCGQFGIKVLHLFSPVPTFTLHSTYMHIHMSGNCGWSCN